MILFQDVPETTLKLFKLEIIGISQTCLRPHTMVCIQICIKIVKIKENNDGNLNRLKILLQKIIKVLNYSQSLL